MAEVETRRSAGRRTDGRRLVPLSIGLFLLIVTALSAFLPVLQGTLWWLGSIAAAAAVNGAAALARVLGAARLLGSVVGAAAGALALTVLCGAETAIGGIIPTPRTIVHFVELSQSAGESIYRQSIPAQPDAGITFLLIFAAVMAAVSIDLMAVSAGAVAPVGLIALAIVVPPSVLMEELPLVAFGATALAYVIVLWADRVRERGGGSLARVLAVGLVAASLAGLGAATVPGFTGTNPYSITRTSSLASSVSPLLHLGEDLTRGGTSTQFTYRTTADEPPRFRLMTLENFNGQTWASAEERAGLFSVEPGSALVREEATELGAGELEKTTVTISGLRDHVLPIPDGAIEVHGVDGTWLWDPADETMHSPSDSTAGLTYTIASIRTDPTAAQLRLAGVPDRGLFATEREIPDEIPDAITSTLDEVIDGIENPYERAYAIQAFLRDGSFAYSESAPVQDGYDGDGLDVIATFLDKRAGYCVHFAATMATMARMIDIPSRIVLGFLPGDADSDDGYTVTTEDLHAWPELYFEGVGWVAFEPTPGRGGTPSYAPEPTSTAEAGAPGDLDPRDFDTQQSATPAPTEDADTTASNDARRDFANPVPAVILGIVALVLLALPALLRLVRRRLRMLRAAGRAPDVAAAWTEIIDTARDLGWQQPISETPRLFGDRLAAAIGADAEAAAALQRIVRAVEAARFGPPGIDRPAGIAADARAILRQLRTHASAPARVRAAIWPPSVFARAVQQTAKLAG